MSINERIQAFRAELRERELIDLVQRHVTSGESYALGATQYVELKQAIAAQFGVHHTEVLIVGSGKLGFSLAPQKRYRPFGDTSDLDIAFCSSALFDAFWQDAFDYSYRGEDWPNFDQFRKYHFRGWMRPDMFPPQRSFERSRQWWEFFRSLTASAAYGRYRITGALYKSWHFLERYQARCIAGCKGQELGG